MYFLPVVVSMYYFYCLYAWPDWRYCWVICQISRLDFLISLESLGKLVTKNKSLK